MLQILGLCSIRSFEHCLKNSSLLEMVGNITGCLEDYPSQNIFRSKMQNCLPTTPFFPKAQFLRQLRLIFSKSFSNADLKITTVEQMTFIYRKETCQTSVPAASLTSYRISCTNWLSCLYMINLYCRLQTPPPPPCHMTPHLLEIPPVTSLPPAFLENAAMGSRKMPHTQTYLQCIS